MVCQFDNQLLATRAFWQLSFWQLFILRGAGALVSNRVRQGEAAFPAEERGHPIAERCAAPDSRGQLDWVRQFADLADVRIAVRVWRGRRQTPARALLGRPG